MLKLYPRVVLSRHLPDHNLKKGDVLTLIDYVPHPSGGENVLYAIVTDQPIPNYEKVSLKSVTAQ